LEDNIKSDLEAVLCEDVDRIQLVQCIVKWLFLENYKETLNFKRKLCHVVDVERRKYRNIEGQEKLI
jgi:hypothetical protein